MMYAEAPRISLRTPGVVKRLPLVMQREERHEQAAYRNRWHREFIYWKKWAYLKSAARLQLKYQRDGFSGKNRQTFSDLLKYIKILRFE